MLRLLEVNEENWLAVRRLSVRKEQEGFLDSALGILARGYVYRAERARVIAVAEEDTILAEDGRIGFIGSRPYYEFRGGTVTERQPDRISAAGRQQAGFFR